ncbi:hypothetical protein RB608_22720 [Nocardioides sp. LHD-245]|uniref:hypothetical protein n=1 Tax=Nocardioides sp. LHD-245 TaxID=3051387 RepID=UPI0027DF0967|nr:hypothetical protein [Nocardioides sp. LHD-245]
MRHPSRAFPCTRCGLSPAALIHHPTANGHAWTPPLDHCAACARPFTGSESGFHAAEYWIATPASALVCRTCLARSRRGALDLTPLLAASLVGAAGREATR